MENWQVMTIPILVMLVVVAFATWNGLVINWKHGKCGSLGWHVLGFVARVLLAIILIVLLWGVWKDMVMWLLVYILMGFTVYNMTINAIMGQSIWYIGNTSVMDKWFRKNKGVYWGVQAAIFVAAVIMIFV